MARDDLSALFRCRCDLCGLCDGFAADDSVEKDLRPGKLYHDAPYGEHGEGDVGDRLDRFLRLFDGSVLRLVQRQSLRALHGLESHAWALRALLLDADLL